MEYLSTPEKYANIITKLTNLAKTNSRVGRCRVVAAIVKRNKIFVIGCNSYEGGALSSRFKKDYLAVYEHAEIAAIKSFLKKYPKRDISKYSLVIVRVKLNKKGEWIWGSSKPCRGCQKAIKYFKMKRVFFLNKKRWVMWL
jgi:tRNA(Arg) A34 adenosine deaminase TadA